MITLKADNRQLTKNAKFSYLADNYASGVSTMTLTSSIGFASAQYVLLSEFGHETSEIFKIDSVNSTTHELTFTTASKFAHSESTKITIIQYNQVKFYHTTTATYATSDPVGSAVDIQADSVYTQVIDSTNSTGFGWFVFYNATSTAVSTNSNAIPYGGFDENSVKKIFDAFWSQLNNKEQKLVTTDDVFSWLNEAYSITRNELNLVNPEYNVATRVTVSVTSGTSEYDLEDDVSDVVAVTDTNGYDVPYLKISDIDYTNANSSGQKTYYYIRNKKIGFVPSPTAAATYYYYYRTKTTVLTSYYDSVDLPDNNFYFLVDFMMYRAGLKLTHPNPEKRYQAFIVGINRMKVTSNKQNANLDSWEIADEAVV